MECRKKGICQERTCTYFIYDIRFQNCALQVDSEMSINEIAFATKMSLDEVEKILEKAIKKLNQFLFYDKMEEIKNKVRKLNIK